MVTAAPADAAQRPRLVRRALLGGVALLVLAALVPTPQPGVETGAVWEQTRTLRGVAPSADDTQRGTPYTPIGLVLIGYALDLDVGDPSGSTAYRVFDFGDEPTAREAANDAVRAGIRLGYTMQSAQWSAGEVYPQEEGFWTDDGWNAEGDQHLVVSLRSPAAWAGSAGSWTVELLLEHTY